MAWTAPVTWAADQLVTAADMNAQIRDNLLVLKTAIDADGKIVAISSTYFASLDGANLTGVAKTAGASTYTAGVQNFNGGATVRLVVPVGADKY